ncbi:hypothetical protein [Paraburkholderia strydomiana]|uniref:5'-methylthioadenosine/S-adenosylhomocysteine nucleosidase family protein n=1 Tax=Paraburkholderia strydomiana TaxID=1245417 RepID=UPI001BE7AE11|nr:hypothetical protein [Paraburkholderia strydomiana]MBT2794566.1 hypothetical protein [Paraburkholderia strydomiana]
MANTKRDRRCDVLLVCAMKDEYDQVIEVSDNRISDWEKIETDDNWLMEGATFEAHGGKPLTVHATWMSRMGMEALAPRVSLQLTSHRPLMLVMSGICAGNREDVNLGDVIFADRVWQYDVGKEKENADGTLFMADSNTMSPPPNWIQRLQSFRLDKNATWPGTRPRLPYDLQAEWLLVQLYRGREDEVRSDPTLAENCPDFGAVVQLLWKREELVEDDLALTETGQKKAKRLDLLSCGPVKDPPHRVHVATIGSGSSVIENKEIFKRLKKLQRKTSGLEMEASMIASLADAHRIPWMVAKGVSDFGDRYKDDRYRDFAARASAECLLSLLASSTDLLFQDVEPMPKVIEPSIRTMAHSAATVPITDYSSINESGQVEFNYERNDGKFTIGQAPWAFETMWTKASDKVIYLYKDPPSIDAIARAVNVTKISDVNDAATFEFSSRVIQLQTGEVAVLRNVNGYYAALTIRSITDRLRGDSVNDVVSFDYQILSDRSRSFSTAPANVRIGSSSPEPMPSVTATILRAALQNQGRLEIQLALLCDLVARYRNDSADIENQVRSALRTIKTAGWGQTFVSDDGLVTITVDKLNDGNVASSGSGAQIPSMTTSPYPVLTSVTDGRNVALVPKPELRGHITDTRTLLRPGDRISIKADAADPAGGKLQYRFRTLHNSVDSRWQDENSWSYQFQTIDIREMCDIAVRIRSERNYHALGE